MGHDYEGHICANWEIPDSDTTGSQKALLIGIREIKQESEEKKLLREIYNNLTTGGIEGCGPWFEKAKRLLGETK